MGSSRKTVLRPSTEYKDMPEDEQREKAKVLTTVVIVLKSSVRSINSSVWLIVCLV